MNIAASTSKAKAKANKPQPIAAKAAPATPALTASVVSMTPARARQLLTRNLVNRRLTQNRVKLLVREISEGRWTLNGEPIILDAAGNLLDGQHRLTAIADAGVAVDVFLVTGINTEASDTIDTGRSRSVADHYVMRGMKYAQVYAAAIVLLGRVERGTWEHATPINIHEAKQIEARHPLLQERLQLSVDLYTGAGVRIPPSVTCVSAYLIDQTESDTKRVSEFWRGLLTGAELAEDDPRLTLRKWTLTEYYGEHGRSHPAMRQRRYLRGLFHTWNAYAERRPLQRLSFKNVELPKLEQAK